MIDWEHPANNDFLLVSQFSVTGAVEMSNDEFRLSNPANSERRVSTVELKKLRKSHFCIRTSPGLPLVVIELKKAGAWEMTNDEFRVSN